MLFFELFPTFMLLVALAAGIFLLMMDRRAARERDTPDTPSDNGGGDVTG